MDNDTQRDRILALEYETRQLKESIASIQESTKSIESSLRELLLVRGDMRKLTSEIVALNRDLDSHREEHGRETRSIWKRIGEMERTDHTERRAFDNRVSAIESQIKTGMWAAMAIIAAVTFVANFLANIIL